MLAAVLLLRSTLEGEETGRSLQEEEQQVKARPAAREREIVMLLSGPCDCGGIQEMSRLDGRVD